MTAQYPDYEISEFLTRKHWEYNNDNTWTSPILPLVEHLERIKAFNPLADTNEASEIIVKLKTASSGDGIEELDLLCKILADVYDFPRWTLEIKDRVPLIRFTAETEIALDIAGYNTSAEEAFKKWHRIEEISERMARNDEDSIAGFEEILRNIRDIFEDESMCSAMQWHTYSWLDVFREEQIQSVISRPIVWTRLDLRGNNATQKGRTKKLVDLDKHLPEKHCLREEHLSTITQKHYNSFFGKGGLLDDVEANKISHEDALKRYDEIMLEEPECEEKVKMTLRVDGREVFLDENRVFVLPEGYDEKKRAKFLSRLNQEQVNFVVYPLEGYAVDSTDAGFSDEKIRFYGNKDDETLMQFLQERGLYIR